jgi:hypothetical protein
MLSITVSGTDRNVSLDVSTQQMQEQIPFSWRTDSQLYSYVNSKYRQPASGAGFVSQPYTAIWDLVWGVTPVEDLAKYKDLATRIPYIAASIRVKANMAISNGFELEGGDEDVRNWLMDWCEKHNFLQTLRVVAWDMMVYGNAYQELCSDENVPPELWWLKGLDPVHMRVRRDEYGNVFGYIQLLTFPPVPFTAQEIMHFKNEPKSNWYEAIYGTSEIRPLILNQAYIDSYERDMATIIGVYLKPMLVVKAGTPERPFNDTQLGTLMEAFSDRRPNTDVFLNFEPWMNYLERQRKAILGVPEIFLGEPSGTNRATADIVMQEFVTRLRMLQEIMGDDVETMHFTRLVEAKFGEGTEVPHIKWKPIWEPSLQEKSAIYATLVQANAARISEWRVAVGLPKEMPPETNALPVPKPQLNQSGNKFGNQATFTKDGKNYLVAEIVASSS